MATHANVAHRWVQRNLNLDIKGYGMFARGYSIYSWGVHFKIARHVMTHKGDYVVLMTTLGYSSSTGKHKTIVRRAIPGAYFNVPNVDADSVIAHLDNLQSYMERANQEYDKAKRARVHGAWHAERALELLSEAKSYAEAFSLVLADPSDVQASVTALNAQRAELRALDTAQRQEAERLIRERNKARDKAKFEEWLVGGFSCPESYYQDEEGFCYIRKYKDDLQTSQGASVPWYHAIKAFQFIKLCRAKGEAFHTNGRVIRVGHYQVDWIDEQGNMKAGCHRFSWSEIERLAIKEKVFDEAPSDEAVTLKAHGALV